ncbi:helix-turn-helix domain-containing protein [Pontimicrobium sp. MEBiC01747]
MKVKKFFLYSFLCLSFFINGQENTTSLKDSIKKNLNSNPEKAIGYIHKYVKLNKEKKNKKNISLGYSILAVAHEKMSQLDSTLYYYNKRLGLLESPIDIIETTHFIARIYDNNYNYNEALRYYNQILELARKEGKEDLVTDIKYTIDLVKAKVGFSKEEQFEEAFKYLKTEYEKQKKTGVSPSLLKFNRKSLIEVYITKKEYNKAIMLIEEGIIDAKTHNNVEFLYYMCEFKSRVQFLLEEYDKTRLAAEKAIQYAKQLKNEVFINEINFRLASIFYNTKSYEESLIKLKMILNNKKEKSALQKSKYYKLIADVYKDMDSVRLSNTYFSKQIEEKEKALQEYLSAIKSIHDIEVREKVSDVQDSYEEELKEEISKKEKEKQTKQLWVVISSVLLLLIVVVVFLNKKKAVKNQQRFEELMVKINTYEKQQSIIKNTANTLNKESILQPVVGITDIEEKPSNTNSILSKENGIKTIIDINEATKKEANVDEEQSTIIKDKKVEEILVKLTKLEEKAYFLRQDCTLHNMAKRLKTNTTYLSKVINTHLGKSFSTYVNDLRINYVIIELKNNKRLRSYSVKAIAEEVGYKNANIFSRYFKEITGITPSVYIKKIQEM